MGNGFFSQLRRCFIRAFLVRDAPNLELGAGMDFDAEVARVLVAMRVLVN